MLSKEKKKKHFHVFNSLANLFFVCKTSKLKVGRECAENTNDLHQWFFRNLVAAAFYPQVGNVYLASGVSHCSLCLKGPSRINGPVRMEASIFSSSHWGRPLFFLFL